MTVIDLVRAAVAELGEGAPAGEVSRFIAERYGARVDVRFVPIYLATLRAEAQRHEARERAARIIEEDRRAPGDELGSDAVLTANPGLGRRRPAATADALELEVEFRARWRPRQRIRQRMRGNPWENALICGSHGHLWGARSLTQLCRADADTSRTSSRESATENR